MSIEKEWFELRETIRAQIAKHGRSIQVVGGTESDPPGTQPFMYTVGNHGLGLPELLIIGTTQSVFAGVLNRLSEIQHDRRKALQHEELISVGGKFPLRIIDTGEIGHKDYTYFARLFYNVYALEVRQVLLPDLEGCWPDTPGCAPPYRDQPILSAMAHPKN